MLIFAHRGFWETEEEKNKQVAFKHAFNRGFGIETDLRDICGKIIISHNMPNGDEISFEELLQIMNGRNLPLALNIKYFCFIDKEMIEMFWPKYSNLNSRWELYNTTLLEEIKFKDWLNLYYRDNKKFVLKNIIFDDVPSF